MQCSSDLRRKIESLGSAKKTRQIPISEVTNPLEDLNAGVDVKRVKVVPDTRMVSAQQFNIPMFALLSTSTVEKSLASLPRFENPVIGPKPHRG
jgi:hypothetical protein